MAKVLMAKVLMAKVLMAKAAGPTVAGLGHQEERRLVLSPPVPSDVRVCEVVCAPCNVKERAVERRRKVKERQWKGDGRSMRGSVNAAEGQGQAVKRRRKAKERQWKGDGRSRKGSANAAEGQGKAVERRRKVK